MPFQVSLRCANAEPNPLHAVENPCFRQLSDAARPACPFFGIVPDTEHQLGSPIVQGDQMKRRFAEVDADRTISLIAFSLTTNSAPGAVQILS